MKSRTLKVDLLSRIEGEASLTLKICGDTLADVALRVFEPPRFFEGLLRGRRLEEAPDITARICGICPVAHQITTVCAMEAALGVEVTPCARELRRLIYCGEWIESHMLHVHLLHAPDFLGYEDAIGMAKNFPREVERGLRLKQMGNRIISAVGGRDVHPINMRVGGFYRLPDKVELQSLRDDLKRSVDDAESAARWVANFPFPEFEPETEFVAMVSESEYPIFEGDIASDRGLRLPASRFYEVFEEFPCAHSTSQHCRLRTGSVYQVGPIARFNLNRERLTPRAGALADELAPGLVRNPFLSIVVRSVETVFALEEALRVVEGYAPEGEPFVRYEARAGEGIGCSEAPRGMCFHRYRVGDDGLIQEADIIPPTTQNLGRIEQDLRELLPPMLNSKGDVLRSACETAVRNYDPCLSCSVHFLDVRIERGQP